MTTSLREHLQATLGAAYAIERELGGGGMSRVFVATEVALGRRVVVKVLAPELTAGVNLERFRREIQLAAQLHHPHIVPLLSAGTAEGLPFYTMPYIEGESLRARLARTGELPVPVAVRILREVASALAYAHSQGIVHRDIKPDNIMLSGGFALVTDFGVAKALAAAGGAVMNQGPAEAGPAHRGEITSLGIALGTPAYMAPEQAAAEPGIDHRADLYALGATGYELLAGQTPFAGRAPLQMLAAHATEAPEHLADLRPAVPAALSDLIMRCLEKRPADRPQSADEVVRFLEAIATPSGGMTPTEAEHLIARSGARSGGRAAAALRARRRRRWLLVSAVLAASAVVAAAIIIPPRIGPRDDDPPAAGPGARPTVVVLPFKNETRAADYDIYAGQAVDALTRAVAQSDLVTVVEGTGDSLPRDARLVVSGRYYLQGDTLQFQARVEDARTRSVLRALPPVRAAARNPAPAFDAMGRRLLGLLAIGTDPRVGSWAQLTDQPPTYEAFQSLLEGLAALNRGDPYAEAMRHFEKAASLDTSYTQAWLWTAFTAFEARQWATADSLGQRLERSRQSYSSFDRAFLDHIRARVRGDPAARLASMRQIVALVPRSEWSAMLAGELLKGGYPREALDTLLGVPPERGFLGQTTTYWTLQADAYHQLGQYADALTAIAAARRRHPNAHELASLEAQNYAALNDLAAVEERVRQVTSIPKTRDFNPAQQLRIIALELGGHGHPKEARRLMERSLEMYRLVPPESLATVVTRQHLAVTHYFLGNLDEARRIYEELAAERRDSLPYLGQLGVIAAERGDRGAAQTISAKLAALADRPYMYGQPSMYRARMAALLGDREAAVALLRDAFLRGAGEYRYLHVDTAINRLAGYPAYEEFVRPRG